MDRGTYVSASGGLIQLRKLEITNANLANVNTPGFKREYLVNETQAFDQTLASFIARKDPYARPDHVRTPGAVNPMAVTDFSAGPVQTTNNPLDVALRDPRDFFAVNSPSGVEYTRAGNFTLNGNGELITPDGLQVQGDGGAITVNGPAQIAPDGSILVNMKPVGKLQVARFEDPNKLERVGGTRFRAGKAQAAPTIVDSPELIPGAVEMSNVSTIGSVIDLITATRAFEMYTKTAQTIDQMNQTAITQVGRR
jgi:flagellar basal-body rod protein FlgG